MNKLEEAQATAQELYRQYEEARNRRADRADQLQRLESERSEAEAEAEAAALLPESGGGGQATATAVKNQSKELQEAIWELEEAEERAREAWEQAKAEVEKIARARVPGLAEDLVNVRERKIQALRDLGTAVLSAASEVEKAGEGEAEIRKEFQDLIHAAKPSTIQRRELENFISSPDQNAPPAAELGYLVRLLVGWFARVDREGVRELLREHGIAPRSGSILGPGGGPAPIISGDTAYAIHQGQPLPY